MPLFEKSLDVEYAICKAPRQSNTDFTRYPLCKLDVFLEELRRNHKTSVRYLIDSNYQLWLAWEGVPGGKVPAHSQMTGSNHAGISCIAAGNIKFSKENNTIIRVNNKSGDFQPAFDNVKWLLAILLANLGPDIFAPSLEFERFHTGTNAIAERLIEPKESVLSEIETLFTPEKIDELKDQPMDVSKLKFGMVIANKRSRFTEEQPGRSKRLAQFFSDLPGSSEPSSSESIFDEYQPIPSDLSEQNNSEERSYANRARRLF